MLLLTACHHRTFIDPSAKLQIIPPDYIKEDPLVKLINMPVYSELEDSFSLDKDGSVQIYAVGELIYNLAEGPRESFFKGDDLTLYFTTPDPEHPGHFFHKHFYLSWSDAHGKNGRATIAKDGILLEGALYKYSISKLHKKAPGGYLAEIKVPWSSLGHDFHPQNNMDIGFDIVLGDADDEYKQKARMALFNGKPDAGKGQLFLAIKPLAVTTAAPQPAGPTENRIKAPQGHIQVDSIIDDTWESLPKYPISNVITGMVKDRYDLSGFCKAMWDKDNLYLMLDIKDNNRRRILQKNIRQMQTFVDYGWIENQKGEKIWEMNALDSKFAGGAFKNQYIDTLLHLPKGKYLVRYISDESHSYNHWNDDPPQTPFYGIVVYAAKK